MLIAALAAAAGAPRGAIAQPDDPLPPNEVLAAVVEQIGETGSPNPALSPELIDPLAALGSFYHAEGDYALAIAALTHARQIARVHYGLHSVEQAPLLLQLARSEEARGNAEAAWNFEQELLALIRRHPVDARLMPFLREIADRRMDVLERYLAGEFPPEIVLGCYYGDRCSAGSRRRVRARLLREAMSYRWHSIGMLVLNEGYSSAELPEQLMEFIVASYRHGEYGFGRRGLRQLHSYDIENSQPWNSLVLMSDWELMFGRSTLSARGLEAALDRYREAYRLLENAAGEQATIESMFSPDVPVVLPSFAPNPLISAKTAASTGYVDVAFDITKRGSSANVEILDSSTNAPRHAKRQLVRLIKRSTFRPRIEDGEIAEAARVFIRYHLSGNED